MFNFFGNLFKGSKNSDASTSFSLPQERELSPEQLQALDSLLTIFFDHFEDHDAKLSADKVRQQFIAGEALSTAINASVENCESRIYLSVDINDPESAAGYAEALCNAHGLLPVIQIDIDNKSTAEVLNKFDQQLSEQGYRFVMNQDVDWGYDGFILPATKANIAIEVAKALGIRLGLGCDEE